MNTSYNNEKYYNLILEKYNNSIKNYKVMLSGQESDADKYLMLYESMNVYPVYPKPIIMPLKKKGEDYTIELQLNKKLKIDLKPTEALTDEVTKKMLEYNAITPQFQKIRNTPKVRRFFDYEIRDTVKDKLGNENISNAWIKMYEILNTYDLLNNSNIVDTFHICEHPGGFIHAIKYYVEHVSKKKHDFVFQSLKPESDPQIFKPDKELLTKYSDKLDYGPKKGDITIPENIMYYANKYKDRKFNLITSDCGLDFSENFVGQESGLYKVFYGAIITAISLSTNNSNYVFKLFSFNDSKTIEFLQLVCLFYERVDIVKTMTTKSGSGENYCVCVNYNYKGDKNKALKILTDYMNSDKDTFLLTNINDTFLQRIYESHKLISLRRITTMNLLLFRFFNYKYIKDNPDIIKYVQNYTNYYSNHFLTYIKLDKPDKISFSLFK